MYRQLVFANLFRQLAGLTAAVGGLAGYFLGVWLGFVPLYSAFGGAIGLWAFVQVVLWRLDKKDRARIAAEQNARFERGVSKRK